jgi:dynactin 1
VQCSTPSQLDENVPVTNLEKTVSYFDTIYPLHLADLPIDCPLYMTDHVKLLLAGLDNIGLEVKRARSLLDRAGEGSAVGLLLKALDTQCREVEGHVKTMKRRLPQDGSQGPISFSAATGASLAQAAVSLALVAKVLATLGKALLQIAVSNPDEGVPAAKVQEALHAAVDTVTEYGDQGIEFCTTCVASALSKLTLIATAVQNGEFDFDGSREASPQVNPVLLRAEEVKAEIRDASQLKYKLEAKDVDMKELRKLLKVKQEEVSEMQVRPIWFGLFETDLARCEKTFWRRSCRTVRRTPS